MLGLFWLCALTILYIYIGYPLAIYLLSTFFHKPVRNGDYEPQVSVVIAAYNEERNIEATIENKLALEYPHNKLEIIVVSDGSTDRTDEIVKRYAKDRVRLIRQEPRSGKTSALNLAVPQAQGEIIVFSDANSIYAPDALRHLVQNFRDPDVGYVTGKMIYINPDGTMIGDGCSAYMKYENFLRAIETNIGSIVGVDGGIDAMRKELFLPMQPDQLPDFILPLANIKKGYRVVYEPRAVLKENALKHSVDEYSMRVRVSLRALWAMFEMRELFNPRDYGIYAIQLLSHKLLRYLAFIFMLGAYVSNLFLIGRSRFLKLSYTFQNIFYVSALVGHKGEKTGSKLGIFYIPHYFVLLNLASAHAFVKFLKGQKQTTWTPRKG